MTRINLLSKEILARQRAKRWIIFGGLSLGIIAFLLFVLYAIQLSYLNSLKAEVKELETELAKYRYVEQELEEIRKEMDEIRERLTAIKEVLKKDRFVWCRILEEMNRCLPNGVWFSSMREEGVGRLRIIASSFDNFDVAAFMVNLKRSPYFDDVELRRLIKRKIGEQEVVEFTLTCRYIGEEGEGS